MDERANDVEDFLRASYSHPDVEQIITWYFMWTQASTVNLKGFFLLCEQLRFFLLRSLAKQDAKVEEMGAQQIKNMVLLRQIATLLSF